jgi:hypothetical protein
VNNKNQTPYDISIVHTGDIATVFGAGAVVVGNKVAVHEVGHQLLQPGGQGANDDGHRGNAGHINSYVAANDKTAAKWDPTINIMNADAIAVPMDNEASGPIDRFYFYSMDIVEMRLLRKSPGRR